MNCKKFFSGALMSLLMMSFLGSQAQEVPLKKDVVLHWVNLQEDNGLIVDMVAVFFHDSNFSLFDEGSKPSRSLELLNKRDYQGLLDSLPTVGFAVLINPHERRDEDGVWGLRSDLALVSIDPATKRYATVYFALSPSNDAFGSNIDPYRIELLDLQSGSNMPVVVDFHESDVFDAGLCMNNEKSLYLLDVKDAQEQQCTPENGVVRKHIGLNGSLKNPTGSPRRVLGGTSVDLGGVTGVHHYDALNADFTRKGAKLGRLVFMEVGNVPSLSGSWYSPEHSGEGFNIETFRRPESNNETALIYWYTYDPVTKKQLYLIGSGEVGVGPIIMYSTEGGSLGSSANPTNVTSKRWGELYIPLSRMYEDCGDSMNVRWFADNPSIPNGGYVIDRLTPPAPPVQSLCKALYPSTRPNG